MAIGADIIEFTEIEKYTLREESIDDLFWECIEPYDEKHNFNLSF